MARQVQDMAGGYIDITTADETSGRQMQDMAGGYIAVAASGGGDEEAALSGSAITGGHGTHAPSHSIPL